jgi:Flp pilus assembly protein TadG
MITQDQETREISMQNNRRMNFCPNRRHRRGSVLIYSFYMMVIMLAFVSFGVDFGHMQSVKTELQRNADATARAALQMYVTYGSSTAVAYAPYIASQPYNPVDSNSGVTPTVTITWGSWNAASRTFTAGGSSPVAVKVVIGRTTANNNSVKLTFPLINGTGEMRQTCDVWAQAIAFLDGSQTATATISGQSDPWLAGMPNGTQASDLDTAPAQSPPLVMTVVPGSTLTFTNVAGGVSNDPSIQLDNANGDPTQMHSHNDDDPLNEPGVQDNIGNITAPINSMIGVFLTPNAPNTQPAPTVWPDYSTQAARDVAVTSTLQAQEPFYIGNGKTSGGTVKTFVVPAGVTRLYLGTMDGHQWNNNLGSYSATITQQQAILMVK